MRTSARWGLNRATNTASAMQHAPVKNATTPTISVNDMPIQHKHNRERAIKERVEKGGGHIVHQQQSTAFDVLDEPSTPQSVTVVLSPNLRRYGCIMSSKTRCSPGTNRVRRQQCI